MYLLKELAFTLVFFIIPYKVVKAELVVENGVIKKSIKMVEYLVIEEVHIPMQEREIQEGPTDKK